LRLHPILLPFRFKRGNIDFLDAYPLTPAKSVPEGAR
jgi:hypothetical protein